MTERAQTDNLIGTNYKKLNLPFEIKMMSQPKNIRGRIVDRVAEFVFHLLVDVFNGRDMHRLQWKPFWKPTVRIREMWLNV